MPHGLSAVPSAQLLLTHYSLHLTAYTAACARTKQVSFVNTALTSAVNVSAKIRLRSDLSRYGLVLGLLRLRHTLPV